MCTKINYKRFRVANLNNIYSMIQVELNDKYTNTSTNNGNEKL